MANQCEFKLKATGFIKDINNLLPKLKQYKAVDIIEEDIEEHDNRYSSLTIIGYCDWSVYSSLINGPYIQNSLLPDCKNHSVVMEVYSSEPGIGFQEHYIINNGELVLDDLVDYREIDVKDYLDNPSEYEDIFEELDVTHEDVLEFIKANKDEEWLAIGGYEQEFKDFYQELHKTSLKDKIEKSSENTQSALKPSLSKEDKTRS